MTPNWGVGDGGAEAQRCRNGRGEGRSKEIEGAEGCRGGENGEGKRAGNQKTLAVDAAWGTEGSARSQAQSADGERACHRGAFVEIASHP